MWFIHSFFIQSTSFDVKLFDLLQRVHIIAYDEKEQQRITSLLNGAGVMPNNKKRPISSEQGRFFR